MASDPRDMFGTRNNTEDSKKRFKSNTESTFDMFNINVAKANKAVDSVFDYAKKGATDFNKYYVKTTSQTMKTVADITVSTYTKVYTQLESMHKSYLSGVVDREMSAASEVAKKWAETRNSASSNNNVIYGSGGQVLSSSSNTTNSTNNTRISAPDMSNFMKSLNTSLGNKVSNYNSHIDKSISSLSEVLPDEVGKATENGAKNGSSTLGKILSATLGKYLDIWIRRFTQGIDKIYNMYESTYTGVSVVMNQNQEQYMSWQSQAMSSINQMGLSNNIAISKVMETLSDVTKQGITGQKAQNKALADTISKTIAPFLDTTTSAYTDLQFKLGDQFVNTMNGMGENISRQVGSQRVFSTGINQIITMLDPIMLNAKADYADKYLGEMMAGLEGVVDAGLMTQEQALQFAYDSSQGATDWYSAVTSDNLLLRTAAINADDPTNVAEIAKEMFSAAGNIYQGVNGVREQSTVGAVINANKYFSQTSDVYDIIGEYGKTTSEYIRSSEMVGKEMMNNFANDKYTTATAMKDIAAENASLGVAQFRQRYPDAYEILENILRMLGLMSGADIFGNIGDRITNSITKKLLNKGSTGGTGSGAGSSGSGGWLTSLVGGKGATAGLSSMQALGNGLVNTHAGTLTSSATTLGGAATAAGAAAGAAMAIYGTSEAVKDFGKAADRGSSDSEKQSAATSGTLNAIGAAGGAAGAAALIALGASNPIGWVALAVGGVALGAAALYKVYNQQSGVMQEVNAKYEQQKEVMEQEQQVRAEQIDSLKTTLENAETTEEKRNAVVSEGIMTQEEANNMTSAQLDTFVDQLKKTNEDLSNKETEFFEDLEKARKEEQESMREQNKEAIMEQIKNETDTDKQKEMLKSLGYTDEQIESIGEQTGGFLGIGTHAKTVEDLLNERTDNQGWFGIGGQSKLDAIDSNTYNDFAEKFGTEGVDTLGDYSTETDQEIAQAKAFLETWKDKKEDMTSLQKQEYDQYKEFLSGQEDITTGKNYDVSMYAAGNPYVASDQMAYIHQGEAVLTKEQNKQYRNVASSIPIFGKFLGGLFGNKSGMQETEEEDAKRSDIITTMNDGFNRLVDAIMSMKTTEDMDKKARASVGIAEPVVSSYAENIVNLTPSMATANK